MNIHESEEKGGGSNLKKKKKKLGWGWIPETIDVDLYLGTTRNIQHTVGD